MPQFTGTCAFRLMPTDELVDGPATASVRPLGDQYVVDYTWTHPDDGPQAGHLLVGAPEESGQITAAWGDTWHQKPGIMTLTGTRDGDVIKLAASYMGDWGWEIDLTGLDATPSMIMRNVVPESALSMAPPGVEVAAGPYDVMVLRVS